MLLTIVERLLACPVTSGNPRTSRTSVVKCDLYRHLIVTDRMPHSHSATLLW